MDEFTSAEAAKWLDVTREAVDLAAREGRLPVVAGDGPRRFSRESLEAYHQARVLERIAALARARETPLSAAAKLRRGLHGGETGLPRPFEARLKEMPDAWRAVFSTAELAAAGVRDGSCRWCRAREFAAFKGMRPVEFSEELRELFAADPCQVCGPALVRPCLDALAAWNHRGDRRPSDVRVVPSEAERRAARELVSRRAVTAAVPVQGDDGKLMVQRRLRQTRERLTAARRRGDTKYAIRLQQTLKSLTADAARVDGQAASRPGTLKCGHRLDAGCSCPRRASR